MTGFNSASSFSLSSSALTASTSCADKFWPLAGDAPLYLSVAQPAEAGCITIDGHIDTDAMSSADSLGFG